MNDARANDCCAYARLRCCGAVVALYVVSGCDRQCCSACSFRMESETPAPSRLLHCVFADTAPTSQYTPTRVFTYLARRKHQLHRVPSTSRATLALTARAGNELACTSTAAVVAATAASAAVASTAAAAPTDTPATPAAAAVAEGCLVSWAGCYEQLPDRPALLIPFRRSLVKHDAVATFDRV